MLKDKNNYNPEIESEILDTLLSKQGLILYLHRGKHHIFRARVVYI
jgi:hypothetical protein